MSRIGKAPVAIPQGVNVKVDSRLVSVEGPLGKLEHEHHPAVSVDVDSTAALVRVSRGDDAKLSRSLHGLTRSLVNNMVEGVTKGYEKRLEIVGVGYLAV